MRTSNLTFSSNSFPYPPLISSHLPTNILVIFVLIYPQYKNNSVNWNTCAYKSNVCFYISLHILGRGLASTADVEDTPRTDLGLLQQLNGQYGPEHCHVATKHLYSEVHVVWTWLQDAGDSWDLHTLYWSQCFPWACSALKLPLDHPERESA